MVKKNPYRVVLDAVLKLPWLEGLGRLEFVGLDNLCCSVGAAVFGTTPLMGRVVDYTKLDKFRRQIGPIVEEEIEAENDHNAYETPLDRKHRMIVWLRAKADARDSQLAAENV